MKKIAITAILLVMAAGAAVAQPAFNRKNHESYLGGGLSAGAAFSSVVPVDAGLSVVGRHGLGDWCDDVVGLGYEVTAGASCNMDGDLAYHYLVAAKIYPFRTWFVSVGYGTLGIEDVDDDARDDGSFILGGTRLGTGLSAMAGYDFVGDLSDGIGIFFSLNAGMQYDTHFKIIAPRAGFTLGMVWGLGGK